MSPPAGSNAGSSGQRPRRSSPHDSSHFESGLKSTVAGDVCLRMTRNRGWTRAPEADGVVAHDREPAPPGMKEAPLVGAGVSTRQDGRLGVGRIVQVPDRYRSLGGGAPDETAARAVERGPELRLRVGELTQPRPVAGAVPDRPESEAARGLRHRQPVTVRAEPDAVVREGGRDACRERRLQHARSGAPLPSPQRRTTTRRSSRTNAIRERSSSSAALGGSEPTTRGGPPSNGHRTMRTMPFEASSVRDPVWTPT